MEQILTTLTYPEVPLHELMRRTAERQPDARAITFHDRSLTFADFDVQSNRVANALHSLRLGSGDRISLYMPNCPEYELLFYGASKLGAISCPLNPSYRERELLHQINDAGSTIIATHASLWPVLQSCRSRLPTVSSVVVVGDVEQSEASGLSYEELVGNAPDVSPAVRVDPSQLVALPYSSGTTGLPKGVMLSHRNLVCNHIQFGTASRLSPSDVYPVYLPLSHIYGVALMGLAMWSGAHQVIMERFDLEKLVAAVHEHGATWLHVVPPVLLALANAPGLDASQFRTVKYALNAAAPLAPDVARRVEQRLGFRVVQAYGLTETSPDTHHTPLDNDAVTLESVGMPVADTEQRVVDLETGDVTLGPGETGELVIKGPQVMQGYWNAPEETARVLRNEWLHTGDIGWVDSDGCAYVVDRKKEMIKYKAFSIAPAELEAVLLEHPDIADCAVIGMPDAESGEVPRAYVVPRAGTALSVEHLAASFANRLAGYKTIGQWEITDLIPRTPSGKILRRVLKQAAIEKRATIT